MATVIIIMPRIMIPIATDSRISITLRSERIEKTIILIIKQSLVTGMFKHGLKMFKKDEYC